MRRVSVVDSHTGGEPTRVVIAGGPDLGTGPLSDRRERFRRDFDPFRSSIVCEPRGSDVLVGALLCEPHEPGCVAGVVYFTTVGPLGMCGHATIGLAVTLAHLGRISAGKHRFDTPVGIVEVDYSGGSRVAFANVPSYRHATRVTVALDDNTLVTGDVAWGGNWFFLCPTPSDIPLSAAHVPALLHYTGRIRKALRRMGITGANGGEIDHVELVGPPHDPRNHARNFVLCPGGSYDRSPCGTGTSAKLACLAADGRLAPGEVWRQESIIGSVFEATYRRDGDRVRPTISGEAFVTGEATLLFDPADPFREGIRS